MSLKQKVINGVDKAFDKIKDLLTEATLTTRNVQGFNLAANQVVSSSAVTVRQVFIEQRIRRSAEGSFASITAYMKSDGHDYTVYDTLTVGTKMYAVTSAVDNQFVVMLELANV